MPAYKTAALSMGALTSRPEYMALAKELTPQLKRTLGGAGFDRSVTDSEYRDTAKAAILESEFQRRSSTGTTDSGLSLDLAEGLTALFQDGRAARHFTSGTHAGMDFAGLTRLVEDSLLLAISSAGGPPPSGHTCCRDLADMLDMAQKIRDWKREAGGRTASARVLQASWDGGWSRSAVLAKYMADCLGVPAVSGDLRELLQSLSKASRTPDNQKTDEEPSWSGDTLGEATPEAIPQTHRAEGGVRAELSAGAGVPWWMADILSAKGIHTADEAKKFLHDGGGAGAVAGHWEMHDMNEAVSFLHRFRGSRGRRLCIFGDYDLDGVSGTSLLYKALQRAGWKNIECKLPSRFKDEETGREGGYGITVGDVERMARETPPVEGLMLVDTGTNAHDAIAKANELGILVLVVDHHQPEHKTKGAPGAHAMLNPWKDADSYPNKHLSAVGVAHKLVSAVYDSLGRQDADDFLDYVGLGMLADHMEITPENRSLIHQALKRISSSKFPGIKELCKGLEDHNGYVSSQEMAFRVNPVLNAPGRMGKPDRAFDILTASTPEEAAELGREVREINEKRKAVARDIKDEAIRQASALPADSKVLTVFGPWHQGVGGTVASQLVEHFGKPVALAGWDDNGKAVGSARAADGSGFDWNEAIQEAKKIGLLTEGGGHKAAAGFTTGKDMLPRLRKFFGEYAASHEATSAGSQEGDGTPRVEVRLSDLGPEAMTHLSSLEPHGPGNPQPVLVSRGVRVSEPVLRSDGKTVSFKVADPGANDPVSCILFGHPQWYPWLAGKSGQAVDIEYQPSWNTFRGKRSLQLVIKAVGPFSQPTA